MTSIMVTGSRDWSNRQIIESYLADFLSMLPDEEVTLMNGGAQGVDQFAKDFWERKNLGNIITYVPDWDHDGEDAPLRRNITMINQDPSFVIIFIYNHSASSEYAYSLARKRGLKAVRVSIDDFM